MDKKLNPCLIASTPHPQSRRVLRNDFENDTSVLSPIGQVSSLACPKPSLPMSKLSLCPDKTSHLKKRKLTISEKVSDSARSAAVRSQLRGVATTAPTLRTNTLSYSHKTFNIYPEPIVLDSDEEEKFLKSITNDRNTPLKKVTKTTAETAKLKNLDKKRTASSKIKNAVVLSSDEEEEFLKSIQKPSPEKKLTKTDTAKLKKSDKNSKVNEKAGKSTQPEEGKSKLLSNGGRLASGLQQKKQATHSSSKALGILSLQQKPLGNLENIQPTVKRPKLVKKSSTKPLGVKEKGPSDIVLEEETSPFPDMTENFSKITKIVNLNHTPIVKDLIDNNTIKWTPRASRKNRKTSFSSLSEEEMDEKSSLNKDYKDGAEGNATNNHTHNKPVAITSNITKLPNEVTSRGCLKENQPNQNSFPAGCLSRFENIVFKPSPHSGGIVAKSLETDSHTFGYVEVKGGETFSGQRPLVTFVMLEGQVKASVQGTTQTLLPGDIIHINADSKYHFQNIGSDHSRLLFVKVKNCS